MKDPKTTLSGIVLIIIGVLSLLFGVGPGEVIHTIGSFDFAPIITQIITILTGTGLLAASDNDVNRG